MLKEVNPEPSQFERALLGALLEGDDPLLAALRFQFSRAALTSRELTGSGFFLELAVPAEVPPVVPANFVLDDVEFSLPRLENGGAANLFVRGGRLALLEAYSHTGGWPASTSGFTIRYLDGAARSIEAMHAAIQSHPRLGS
jgi:hypothetical protein